MVTTTTKTLNYSITKGNTTNSVNATITSTPGFNSNYLGKVPGILKLLELALAIAALVMIATLRQEMNPEMTLNTNVTATTVAPVGPITTTPAPRVVPGPLITKSYTRELYLNGEVYFLCAHSVVISVLVIVLGAYLFHTTSAMIIPKATTLENVANLILALLLLAAGIVEIVQTVGWGTGYVQDNKGGLETVAANGERWRWSEVSRMPVDNAALRIAAGVIALVNALLLIGSFVLSRKELAGPKTL